MELLTKIPADELIDKQYQLTAGYCLEQFKQQHAIFVEIANYGVVTNYSHFELFISGENYQIRYPIGQHDKEVNVSYPQAPLTLEHLPTTYSQMRILSHCGSQIPPDRLWNGMGGSEPFPGEISTFNFRKVHGSQKLPPACFTMHPSWDIRHPIDDLFSCEAEKMTVIGEENPEGIECLIVDFHTTSEEMISNLQDKGTIKTEPGQYLYRAWLDVKQGGIPILIKRWGWNPSRINDKEADMKRGGPHFVIRTKKTTALSNGGFYPSVTILERYDTHVLNQEYTQEDILADKVKLPSYISERETYTCEIHEQSEPLTPEFFTFEFLPNQKFYDRQNERIAGALESQPLITPGTPAPALEIARWLDGNNHQLEDFRGQVVVLDFWGLWCGSCRRDVPMNAKLQSRYQDKPVTFISIHTATDDLDKNEASIRKFVQEKNWNYLAAIDSGSMLENSTTKMAYGIRAFPNLIIISSEGDVVYNEQFPSSELAGVIEKSCDELTPEDEAKIKAFVKKLFAKAGEVWPGEENVTEEMSNRVRLFYLIREIDKALAK